MHILHLNQTNQRNQILFQYLRDKKKKRKKGAQKRGGGVKIHPFHPPWIRACFLSAQNMVRVIEGKMIWKWSEGKQKLLRVSGRFLVIGRQLYLNFKKKDKLELEKPTSLLLEERRTLSYLEKLKFTFFSEKRKCKQTHKPHYQPEISSTTSVPWLVQNKPSTQS